MYNITFVEALEIVKSRDKYKEYELKRGIDLLKLYSHLATKEELEFIESL